MTARRPILRVDGRGSEGDSAALVIYKHEGIVEIVITEEKNGDASIELQLDEVREIARALLDDLRSDR